MVEGKLPDAVSLLPRILAYLIDASVYVVALLIILIFAIILDVGFGLSIRDLELALMLVIIFTPILLGYIYFLTRDGWGGHGVGKSIMKLKVVDISSKKPISFRTSAKRSAFLTLLGPVELILTLRQPNHRRLGDFFNHTMVVRK
ncbi:MAG: RDD family protein [Candidatus Saganbacteria bacterium]|nr:RDD family protein [Candidatus Saganbacteria bacterium]